MDIEEKLESMKLLFNPKNIAIIGGTDSMMKIGSMVVMSVLSCGFTKKAYIINPNPKYQNKKIQGMDVYPSLDRCPEPIDLAGIVVPANRVVDSIKQTIENDIKAAVVITAGFGEVKSEDRQSENKELIRVAEKGGLIFVGPNSMGIYSSEDQTSPLHLGFGWMMPRPGNISIVSQSGTMGSILGNALQGIRYFVSSGNEASLTLEDYLEYYARDKETKYIALFAEMLRNGSRFKEICTEITKTKPVILLKAGITKTGARAANSHTGSIAGSLDIYKSVFKQVGVIYAEGIEEFIYLIKGAQHLLPLPDNRLRIGIVSGGGGFVVHFTDLCEKHGLNVVDLNLEPNGPKLIEEISKYLPFYWSRNNPIDMVASANFGLYLKLMELMLDSGCFDIVCTVSSAGLKDRLLYFKPINAYGEQLKERMKSLFENRTEDIVNKEINVALKFPDKKVIYLSYTGSSSEAAFEKYEENNIMVFGVGNQENAPIVLKKLHEYQKYVNSHTIIKSKNSA